MDFTVAGITTDLISSLRSKADSAIPTTSYVWPSIS